MNPSRPRWPGARAPAVALMLALLAAGCGPGVGGTGTGGGAAPPPTPAASDAPVCAADFASLLDCPAPASGMPAGAGTAPVLFADAEPQSLVTATLAGNHVSLDAACLRLQFGGDWGVTSLGTRFWGIATLSGVAQPASLAVQAVQGVGGRLELRLVDADEKLLYGPVTLQKAAAPTTPAPCP